MDLQVKNLKVDNSTTLRQNSLPSPYYILPRERQIAHPSQLRGKTMKTYFKMYALSQLCNFE